MQLKSWKYFLTNRTNISVQQSAYYITYEIIIDCTICRLKKRENTDNYNDASHSNKYRLKFCSRINTISLCVQFQHYMYRNVGFHSKMGME